MSITAQTKTYLKNEIESATPLKRVVMLYDGAVSFLTEAREKMEYKKYTEATIANIRAQNIIAELKNSLNMEYGELPARLDRLYSYFIKKMISANIERDPKALEEVIKSLKEVRSSWSQLCENEKGGKND